MSSQSKVVTNSEKKGFFNSQEKKVAKFFDKNYQHSLKAGEDDTLEGFVTQKKKKKKVRTHLHIDK